MPATQRTSIKVIGSVMGMTPYIDWADERAKAGRKSAKKARRKANKQKAKSVTETRPQKPGKDNFYLSRAWRELRYAALKANDGRCELCGASKHDGAQLHVDHIFPRSKFPHLQLEITNTQILCSDCNIGKSNRDYTDWRDRDNHWAFLDEKIEKIIDPASTAQ